MQSGILLDRNVFPARWAAFEPIHGSGVMPSCIRYRDNWPHKQQLNEGIITMHVSGEPMVCYMDRELKIHILCGSI
jgi:hypothetical protein